MDNDLCNDDDTSIKTQTIWQLIEIDAEEKKENTQWQKHQQM